MPDTLASPVQHSAPGPARARRRGPSRDFMVRLLVLAALAKLAALGARLYIIYVVYDGVADAVGYIGAGSRMVDLIRSGQLPQEATQTGTEFMRFVVGVLMSITGPNSTVAFVTFTGLSFLGLLLFHKAFVLAVPDGAHRKHALLTFFLPTMLFWTSSVGKEAWMVFGFGVATYGAARAYRRLRFGYVLTGLGLAMTFMVRPHMGALFGAAFAVGFLVRPAARGVRPGWLSWSIGVAAAAVAAFVMIGSIGELLPTGEDDGGSVFEQISEVTEDRTSKGGSQFENEPVTDVGSFLKALITVPFRPFPWEAHNAQALIASLEGLMLLGLTVHGARRLRYLPRTALRTPLLALSATYTVGFVVAFSAIGNFGILARQRAQLLPFLVMLLCLPVGRGSDDGEDGPTRDVEPQQRVVPSSTALVLVNADDRS